MAERQMAVYVRLVGHDSLRRVIRLEGGVETTLEYDARELSRIKPSAHGADGPATPHPYGGVVRLDGVDTARVFRSMAPLTGYQGSVPLTTPHGTLRMVVQSEIVFEDGVYLSHFRLSVDEVTLYEDRYGKVLVARVPAGTPVPVRLMSFPATLQQPDQYGDGAPAGSDPEEIPFGERKALMDAVGTAAELAEAGRLAEGRKVLLTGLERARNYAPGVPWSQELAARWEMAVENYTTRYEDGPRKPRSLKEFDFARPREIERLEKRIEEYRSWTRLRGLLLSFLFLAAGLFLFNNHLFAGFAGFGIGSLFDGVVLRRMDEARMTALQAEIAELQAAHKRLLKQRSDNG